MLQVVDTTIALMAPKILRSTLRMTNLFLLSGATFRRSRAQDDNSLHSALCHATRG